MRLFECQEIKPFAFVVIKSALNRAIAIHSRFGQLRMKIGMIEANSAASAEMTREQGKSMLLSLASSETKVVKNETTKEIIMASKKDPTLFVLAIVASQRSISALALSGLTPLSSRKQGTSWTLENG